MAEKASLAGRTLAIERAHAVVTGRAIETSGSSTVVDVVTARDSGPPVHTDAGEGAQGVDARGTVLTDVRPYGALVDVS